MTTTKPGTETITATICPDDDEPGAFRCVVYVSRYAGVCGPAEVFEVETGEPATEVEAKLTRFGYDITGPWKPRESYSGTRYEAPLARRD